MNIQNMIESATETVTLPNTAKRMNCRSMTAEQFRAYYSAMRDDVLKHNASRATQANVRAVCGLVVGKMESASDVAKRIRCGNNAQHFDFYGTTVSIVSVPKSKLSDTVVNDNNMLETYGKTDAIRIAIMTAKTVVSDKKTDKTSK